MTFFPVLLFLAAVFPPSFLQDNNEEAIASLSTTLKNVQEEIVKKHNQLRKSVSPRASDMLKMEWSDEAASRAQKWANQCIYEHSQPDLRKINTSCGENLFMSTHAIPWSEVIQNWYDEYRDMNYGVGPKTPKAVTGHYTQVVWNTSFRVGCAYAFCPKQYLKFFMVCHYCPSGNNVARLYTPYTKGTPCAKCPGHCDDELCTNSCDYKDDFSNCGDLKKSVTCEHPIVKNNCTATCNCENKIH
ncbi:CAP domain-containing protein [Salmonella enterica]|nr:CAP domain-containing protein [Salmonella enterica]